MLDSDPKGVLYLRALRTKAQASSFGAFRFGPANSWNVENWECQRGFVPVHPQYPAVSGLEMGRTVREDLKSDLKIWKEVERMVKLAIDKSSLSGLRVLSHVRSRR